MVFTIGMIVTIGIDPHKATHTAAVVDGSEVVVAELRFAADARQRDRLLSFAARFALLTWAIEQATGVGGLLARIEASDQQRRLPPTRHRYAPLDSGPGRADGTLNRVTGSAP
jgi:hypothetical protein